MRKVRKVEGAKFTPPTASATAEPIKKQEHPAITVGTNEILSGRTL